MVMTKFSKEEINNMVNERTMCPSDKLIAALKKPANKTVSKSAMSYLQSLRDECNHV
jgi:hypothetical protein